MRHTDFQNLSISMEQADNDDFFIETTDLGEAVIQLNFFFDQLTNKVLQQILQKCPSFFFPNHLNLLFQ